MAWSPSKTPLMDALLIRSITLSAIPVKISAEVQLRIHHNLLGHGTRGAVKEVYSRPQALSQCRRWLATHLPLARTVEVTSTSTWPRRLQAIKPGAAAIASIQAGIQYGLDAIATNIEDNEENLTRFAVISHESPPRSGKDKTAIMFQLEHRPGTLADAMSIFKAKQSQLKLD